MSGRRTTRRRFLVAAMITGGLGLVSIGHTLNTAHGDWLEAFGQKPAEDLRVSDQFAVDDGVVAEGHLVAYPGAQVRQL